MCNAADARPESGSGSDSLSTVSAILPVSRETGERLSEFVALLRKWDRATDLIAPSTRDAIWTRHVADSAQLVRLFPNARRWVDLGSGAGFPGIVLAIFMAEHPATHVDLIESNARKCAFLREAVRGLKLPATVHQGRIESIVASWLKPLDIVTARALAPLGQLLGLAAPLVRDGSRAAFHKGRDYAREIAEASKDWDFAVAIHPSLVDNDGVILEITRLAAKSPAVRDDRHRTQ